MSIDIEPDVAPPAAPFPHKRPNATSKADISAPTESSEGDGRSIARGIKRISYPLASFESTPHNVASIAFLLGALWSIGLTRVLIHFFSPNESTWFIWSTNSDHLAPQGLIRAIFSPTLGMYLACWSLFHLFEFVVTSMYNPGKLSVSSFLLDNGGPYHVAHGFGILEHILEEAYLPPKYRVFKHFSPLIVAGWVLLIGGQILRSFAMISAAQNFSHIIQTKRHDDHSLVKTGIYAWSRHPSYAGFCWWALGTQIMLVNPIAILGFLWALNSFFSERIRNEERLLVKFFGDDYVQYRKNVPTRIWFVK